MLIQPWVSTCNWFYLQMIFWCHLASENLWTLKVVLSCIITSFRSMETLALDHKDSFSIIYLTSNFIFNNLFSYCLSFTLFSHFLNRSPPVSILLPFTMFQECLVLLGNDFIPENIRQLTGFNWRISLTVILKCEICHNYSHHAKKEEVGFPSWGGTAPGKQFMIYSSFR